MSAEAWMLVGLLIVLAAMLLGGAPVSDEGRITTPRALPRSRDTDEE